MNNTVLKNLSIATLPFTLVACSSSDSSTPTLDSQVVRSAFIQVLDANVDNRLEFSALFAEVEQPALVSDLIPRTTSAVTEDSCEFSIVNPATEDTELEVDGPDFSIITAGEVINVSGPSGSIVDMTFSPVFLTYDGFVQLTDETASRMVMDIPGGDFPAVSNIAIPDVEPFVLTSHDPDERFPISIATEFTWEAGTGSNSGVWMYSNLGSTRVDADGDETQLEIELDCILVDDGQFVLPEAIQSQLLEADIDELRFNMAREVINVLLDGDTLITVTRHSGDV